MIWIANILEGRDWNNMTDLSIRLNEYLFTYNGKHFSLGNLNNILGTFGLLGTIMVANRGEFVDRLVRAVELVL